MSTSCLPALRSWLTSHLHMSGRGVSSLTHIATHQMMTREYEEEFAPRNLRRLKFFEALPPSDVGRAYHEKLNKAYTNPRAILKIYRDYIKLDDHPNYNWLIRCFCQLANTFGFNSFWSTRDKQVLHSIPHFKYLVYDVIERTALLQPPQVPRLLYSLAALEYRSWHLLPSLLDAVLEHLPRWRLPVLCNMALCLSLLGVGDNSGNNQFGPEAKLSKDYSGVVQAICSEVQRRYFCVPDGMTNDDYVYRRGDEGTAFDLSGLAFAMVLSNLYTLPGVEESPIVEALRRASSRLSEENLAYSGWVQFFLYQCLYCCDCEKPTNEVEIKQAVPLWIQKSLHMRWLDGILVNAQPQGSEKVQLSVDEALKRLNVKDALINCSAGRPWDEQHCWFAGHLIKSKSLCLEYDHLMPLGPGRPKVSGWLQLRSRLFNGFGFSVATLHKCHWDSLSDDQKDAELLRLLTAFRDVSIPEEPQQSEYTEDRNRVNMKHKRRRFESWPPEQYTV